MYTTVNYKQTIVEEAVYLYLFMYLVRALLYGASNIGNTLTVWGKNPRNYSILVKNAPELCRIKSNHWCSRLHCVWTSFPSFHTAFFPLCVDFHSWVKMFGDATSGSCARLSTITWWVLGDFPPFGNGRGLGLRKNPHGFSPSKGTIWFATKLQVNNSLRQCCGSGSVCFWASWIRIR